MTTTLNASTAGAGGFIATSDNSGSLALQTAGTTAITVDASQQVGIGGTPVKTLSILPTSIRRMDFYVRDPGVDDSLVIRSQHATNNNIRDMILEGNNVKVFTGADSGSSGSERMRIDSSGNVMVGSTSRVNDSILSATQSANTGGLGVLASNASYSATVICGSTSRASSSNFDFLGMYTNGTSTAQFRVGGNGVIYAQNTSVQSISDQRLKENIRDSSDGLAVVNALRPVRYDWKKGYGNDQKNQLGFIAQEIETVFPESVSEWQINKDEETTYKTVGPSALIPVLVKAIQELKAINDTQAETINALTARIVALEGQ